MASPTADRRRRRWRRVVLVLVLVGALGGGPLGAVRPSAGQDRSLSAAEAAELAREAVDDDDALNRLRSVSQIDGRPVDLAAATEELGPDRASRLEALAADLGVASDAGRAAPPAEAARRSAEEVLDARKYQERDVPRPFRRPLAWLADRLRPVERWFERTFGPLLDTPGGTAVLFVVLMGAVGALTALVIRRRSRAAVERSARHRLVDPSLDPADLEGRAAEAGAAGDHGEEVRLRYLAGLVRLTRADRLVLRLDTTPEAAARQVGLPAMDRLTVAFEEIVYGGRPATADDAEAARSGWTEVLGRRPVERSR